MASIRTSNRQAWNIILVSLTFQGFTLGLYTYCFTFWILPWSEEFNASRAQIMIAFVLCQIVSAMLSPLVGRLLDRLPVQCVVACGLSIYAVGLFAISNASSLWQIFLCYSFLLSIGLSSAGPMAGQWLAVHWFQKGRGAAQGVVSIGSSIGGFLCPPIVTLLLSEYGWRTTHQILSAFAVLVLVPLVLAFVRAPALPLVADVSHSGAAPSTLSAGSILTSSQFWQIVIALAPLSLSIVVFTTNLAPYSFDLGIDAQKASFGMSIFAFAMIVGKLGSGFICDLLDFRRAYLVLIVLLFGGQLLLIIGAGEITFFLVSGLIGLSAGSYLTMSSNVVSNLYPTEHFGSVLGMLFLCNSSVSLAIPIAGWLREALGSYSMVWMLVMVLSIACSAFMLRLRSKPRPQNAGA